MDEQGEGAVLTMTVDGRTYTLKGPLKVVDQGSKGFLDTVKAIETSRQVGQPDSELREERSPTPPGKLVSRAFGFDRDEGVVFLNIDTPWKRGRNPDSLLLLIFAHKELQGVSDVSARDLLASAKRSRLKIDRVDRFLDKYGELLVKGGTTYSRTYGLKDAGIQKARELLERLFG